MRGGFNTNPSPPSLKKGRSKKQKINFPLLERGRQGDLIQIHPNLPLQREEE